MTRTRIALFLGGIVFGIAGLAMASGITEGEPDPTQEEPVEAKSTVTYDEEAREFDYSSVERSPEPNFIPEGYKPAKSDVSECKDMLNDPSLASQTSAPGMELGHDETNDRLDGCRLIVAVDAKEIEPGWYSNADFEAALDASPAAEVKEGDE